MNNDLYIFSEKICPNGTVTITDNNDVVIGTQSVASGGVATIKTSVKDSDGVVIPLDSTNFTGGNLDLILPDETLNIYVNGNFDQSVTFTPFSNPNIIITP